MDRRVSNSLRRIEQSLDEIDNPRIYPRNDRGQGRTISPTVKLKELENLIRRLGEVEGIIKTDDSEHIEWFRGLKLRIEEKINKIFNPHVLKADQAM